MTAALALAGATLTIVGVATMTPPGVLLWIPGFVLLLWAFIRHQDRHQRNARRRRDSRRGFIAWPR